jgi:hypothetical protein
MSGLWHEEVQAHLADMRHVDPSGAGVVHA